MQSSRLLKCARLVGFHVRCVALAWLSLASGAHAQVIAPFVCPVDPYVYPERCEKLARRQQRQLEKQARAAEVEIYRAQHPLRVSAIIESDLFMLGLGNSYVAGFWGLAAGPSLLHELAPAWAVRADLLGRFGHGHISNWNIDSGGPIDATAGFFGGVELHGALLRRMGAVYLGPALSLGFLHLNDQTLHEDAFEHEDGFDHGNHRTVQVPHDAAFFAGGFVLGGEPVPDGQVGLNLHFMPGVWNDFRHLYLDLALVVTIKLWD
jgi:hypothetical protein